VSMPRSVDSPLPQKECPTSCKIARVDVPVNRNSTRAKKLEKMPDFVCIRHKTRLFAAGGHLSTISPSLHALVHNTSRLTKKQGLFSVLHKIRPLAQFPYRELGRNSRLIIALFCDTILNRRPALNFILAPNERSVSREKYKRKAQSVRNQ